MRGIHVLACLLIGSCTPDNSTGVDQEVCDNGVDDDGNGLADCADVRCNFLEACLGRSSCGDGVRQGRELCDGADVAGQTCADQGFLAGALRCNAACDGFDNSACILALTCGDGAIQVPEECDGANLGDATCFSRGYATGDLTCATTCELDESDCEGVNPCGNGVIDTGEDCDGAQLGDETCLTAGDFIAGELACAGDCSFDTSGCAASVCGDGRIDADEACDGENLPEDRSCTTEGFVRGVLRCNPTCNAFDTTDCSLCGNDTIDGTEVCDGTDLDSTTCEDLGLLPGVLGCLDDCSGFKTSGCASCGNDTVEDHEACDPSVVASFDCRDFGYATGAAPCTSECLIDYSACTGFWQCGNGAIDGQEYCDNSANPNLFVNPFTGGIDTLNCAVLQPFLPGAAANPISCTNDCTINVTGCGLGTDDLCQLADAYGDNACNGCDHISGTIEPECPSPTCGDGRADGSASSGLPLPQWEWCDGDDLRGATCELYHFAGGTLACRNDCSFDFSDCIPAVCGNGVLEGREVCEPGVTTCVDVGGTGTMNCRPGCLRYTGCTF